MLLLWISHNRNYISATLAPLSSYYATFKSQFSYTLKQINIWLLKWTYFETLACLFMKVHILEKCFYLVSKVENKAWYSCHNTSAIILYREDQRKMTPPYFDSISRNVPPPSLSLRLLKRLFTSELITTFLLVIIRSRCFGKQKFVELPNMATTVCCSCYETKDQWIM